MNKDKSEQQSQQGIVEGWRKTLIQYWPDEVEIDKRSFSAIEIILLAQAEHTRKETLEEVVEKFGYYVGGDEVYGYTNLEEAIQSLINKQ